jgi:hypothetical protein
VKSSKAIRLKKQRKGVWNPPTGKPITVLGMEWIGMLILGMHGVPEVATMRWWTRKGKGASTQREQEKTLAWQVTRRWGRRVLPIFDRGYGGGPVTLAYAYLLSLLSPALEKGREWLLRQYCHRTGKRYREAKLPLYRLRWALSRFWKEHRPVFRFALFAKPDLSNICSKSPG